MIDPKIQEIIDSHKPLLTERVSNVVYHFTTLGALWKIFKDDRLYLSSALEKSSDDIDKNKKFFLSLTRQRNGELGYSSNREVRITLDGDKLNQRFSGRSFDYWGDSMGKQFYYRDMRDNGRKDTTQSRTENEDRILYNKPYIDGFKEYVTRIDILADKNSIEKEMPYLIRLAHTKYIYIYNNKKDFNFQTQNTINDEIINEGDYTQHITGNERVIPKGIIGDELARILTFMLEFEYDSNYKDKYGILLCKYGLERYNKFVYSKVQRGINLNDVYISRSLRVIHQSHDVDAWIKTSQMVMDFFKRHKFANEREFMTALHNKNLRRYKRPEKDWDKRIEVLVFITHSNRKTIIVHPNTDSFWSLCPNTRGWLIDDIMSNIESHNSKSDEHFRKYLQHLVRNEVPISHMIQFFDKLKVPQYVIDNLLGGYFETRELTYEDSWRYNYLSEEDKEEFENMFVMG